MDMNKGRGRELVGGGGRKQEEGYGEDALSTCMKMSTSKFNLKKVLIE